ncbi:MAG TPA: flagellar hook-basal body complex protein [bacterium]|nr:flagellar hook-basal body complex protein [bacterium]
MSFAFQTPVAALNEHQNRIKMLSENIANINTPGFKGNRMTFVETLGSVSGVKQFEFSQGDIKSTGKVTDLAIQGESFFVLNNGEKNMYSRAGSFEVNEQGELVNVDGLNVQGWMQDISEPNPTLSNNLRDIVIDPNLSIPAEATENAWLSGNLNSALETTTEVWQTEEALTENENMFESTQITSGSPLSVDSPLEVTETNDSFQVSFDGAVAETVTITNDTYDSLDDLVDELNTQFNSNVNLSGKIKAYNSNETLQIRNVANEDDTTMELIAGENTAGDNDALTDLGIAPGTSTFKFAGEDTDLNSLLQVSEDLQAGDTIVISGSDSEGNSISTEYTYSAGDTVGAILTEINNAYSGSSTAELEDGQIILTDDEAGDSSTTLSLAAASSNTGAISMPLFNSTEEGSTATVNSSIEVYDSIGESHTIGLKIEKTDTDGEWNWKAEVPDGSPEGMKITTGSSGKITFDKNGNLRSFSYDGNADSLTVTPGNGAQNMEIKLHAGSTESATGLTQYNSVSSVQMKDQDGLASGKIEGFNFKKDGSIIASFTNGENAKIGQVATAKFANPGGLEKAGGSNFVPTQDSGLASIGKADSQESEIKSESLETSTVDLADQFTKLIEAQNSYQAAAKVINTFEEVATQASQLKR